MKRVLVFLLLLAAATNSVALTAIVNVNVIPMRSETVVASQTVLVDGELITVIGNVDDVRVPEGALLIDGTDRYLMPGLVEMHGHVTSTEPTDVQRLFRLFLANGVTTVRGMLGRAAHLELRTQIAAGGVFGPRLITSGPSLNGNSVSGPTAAADMVRAQHSAGYDFLKIHPGLSRAEFIAIADTANELGMPFAGHVPADVGIELAFNKGMSTIDHLDGYMEALLPANVDRSGGFGGFFGVMLADQAIAARLPELAAATKAAGVANVPTESLFEQVVNSVSSADLASHAEMQYVPAATLRQWLNSRDETQGDRDFDASVAARAIDLRRELILELHKAGATLLLGSDAPQIFNVPGFSLHRELGFMVDAGLTPFEALQTGTSAPAAFFNLNTGFVEVGKVADLLLLDANPLTDISNSGRVHGVLARGRWASAVDLLDDVN